MRILISGETGTGKGVVARALHKNSNRVGELVSLNCTAIPETLPTLAARREDIEALILHFLEKHLRAAASEIPQIAPRTLVLLRSYPWPGNVRELENVIESASHFVKGQMLLPEHLPDHLLHISEKPSTLENDRDVMVSLDMTLEEVQETFIRKVLASLNGNRTQAAKKLGIGRSTLQRKLKKYEIYFADVDS